MNNDEQDPKEENCIDSIITLYPVYNEYDELDEKELLRLKRLNAAVLKFADASEAILRLKRKGPRLAIFVRAHEGVRDRQEILEHITKDFKE